MCPLDVTTGEFTQKHSSKKSDVSIQRLTTLPSELTRSTAVVCSSTGAFFPRSIQPVMITSWLVGSTAMPARFEQRVTEFVVEWFELFQARQHPFGGAFRERDLAGFHGHRRERVELGRRGVELIDPYAFFQRRSRLGHEHVGAFQRWVERHALDFVFFFPARVFGFERRGGDRFVFAPALHELLDTELRAFADRVDDPQAAVALVDPECVFGFFELTRCVPLFAEAFEFAPRRFGRLRGAREREDAQQRDRRQRGDASGQAWAVGHRGSVLVACLR